MYINKQNLWKRHAESPQHENITVQAEQQAAQTYTSPTKAFQPVRKISKDTVELYA